MTYKNSARWFALLALSGVLAAGCASTDDDSGEDLSGTGDAISQKEAADQLELTEQIVSAEPATMGNKIGISRWDVYVTSGKDANGLVAFATDDTKAADVKFALVLDAQSGQGTVLQYDKSGPSAKQQTLSPQVIEALRTELQALQTKLASKGNLNPKSVRIQAKGDATQCALDIGAYALSAFALVLGVGQAALAVQAVAVASTSLAVAFGVQSLGAVTVGAWAMTMLRDSWDSTSRHCKGAFEGSQTDSRLRKNTLDRSW